MKKKLQTLLLVVGLVLPWAFAEAATLYVTSSGNNSRTYSQAQSPDSSLLTIAQAITLASDGDYIMVGSGTFAGFTVSKRVTIIGAGADGASVTTVNSAVTLSSSLSGSLRQGLRNLRISGVSGSGITITTGKVDLYNVYILGSSANGINITTTSDDLVMVGCAINSNSVGITVANNVGVNGWVIRNCQIRNNTNEGLAFTQTTNPSTVDVTNITVTNTAFDNNQTGTGGNKQVLQINKLSNATFTNCVFQRSGTNTTAASNLVNLALFGKSYSNISFKYCKFYTVTNESGLQKRGIYVQPDATTASLSNFSVDQCEFVGTGSGRLNAGINLQNYLSGTLSLKNNIWPQAWRVGAGLQVFGPPVATPGYTGGATATNCYFNALGASKTGKAVFGGAATTSGSNAIATSGIITANNPTAGLSGACTPTTPYSGTGGIFTVSSYNSGTGVITATTNASSSTAVSVNIFDLSKLEGASQISSVTNWNTDLDISGFQTTTLGSGYYAPVYRMNSSDAFQASYSSVTNALAAASNGDIISNISAITMSGSDANLSIPASSTITFVVNGTGRFNPASQATFGAITIPSGSTLKLGSDLLVSGTLTINGTLNLNGYALVMTGTSSFAGSGNITDATGYGSIVLRGSGRTMGTVNFSSANLAAIVDSTSGTNTLTATGSLSLSENGYTYLGSSITASSLSLTNNGYAATGAGSFNFSAGGNLTLNGSIPVAIPAYSLNNLTVNNSAGAYLTGNSTVDGVLALSSGNLRVFSRTLTLGGTTSVTSGNLVTTQTSNIAVTGSGNITLPAFSTVLGLTINRSGIASLAGNLTTYGTITMTAGTFDLSSYRLNLNHGSSFSGSGAVIRGNTNSVLYLHGATSGTLTSAGTLNFDAAPNNKLGTLWSLRNVTLGSDVQIGTRLRIRRGTFAAGGNNILFLSSASGTASLDTVDASATLTGFTNITAQRWYGTSARWMLVGTPIQSKTLSDWQESALGTNGINFTFNTGGGNQPSVFTFSGGASTWTAGSAATLSQTFAPGRGLRIYARNAFLTLNNGPSGLYGAPAGPAIMYWNGTPVTGSFNFPTLTSTGTGWNLVANPYIATLDWEAESNWTRTNLQNTMMYWDNTTYRGLIKVGPSYVQYNSGSSLIPSGQGFFVKGISGTPALSVTENAKGTSISSFFRVAAAPVMRATLSNGTSTDEVIFSFDNNFGYTRNLDQDHDVLKLSGNVLNVAAFSADNVALTADLRPVPTTSDSIRLRVQAAATGTYTLNFTNLAPNQDFYLRDRKLNTLTNLRQNPVYSFSINTGDTTTFGNNRFLLVTVANLTGIKDQTGSSRSAQLFPNPTNGQVLQLAVNGISKAQTVTVTAYDALGRVAGQKTVWIAEGGDVVAVPFTGMAPGIYTFRMIGQEVNATQKVLVNN